MRWKYLLPARVCDSLKTESLHEAESSVRQAVPDHAPHEQNRYRHLIDDVHHRSWLGTFKMFDRDGGGDISLQEIGLLFRQLGYAPAEAEMRALVDEVDADDSGTVDFEEFCLLMLRMQRAERTPEWLHAIFVPPHPDDVEEAIAQGGKPPD